MWLLLGFGVVLTALVILYLRRCGAFAIAHGRWLFMWG